MHYDPVELFLDAVKKAGLASEQELQSYTQEIRSQQPGSQEEVAARLVERNVLTPYQAERLLLGEGEDCVLAGRYHLLEKIGSGGMGSVFRARDTQLDRIVAIKVMAAHNLSNSDAVVRFKREARALAQLALPSVVQAFDSGEDRGRNFLVMEFVKGMGLDQLVRNKGKVPPTIAADYIYQTAVGMQRAHDRGLVHRDLKPGNLLLTPEGEIKILDLGLARFMQDQIPDAELTRENIGLGTPDYMAPEQFRDARNVDARADIYSLGCTLYYLIAGLVPFPGSSLSEKAHAHENKEPPPLADRCPEIPAGLAAAIGKMLAKRPADRFQSMRELAEALAPYVAGSSPSLPSILQTVSFHGSQLTVGPHRRRSRRPLVVGSIAGVAVLAVLLAIFLPPLWQKEETPGGQQQVSQNNSQQKPLEKPPTGNQKPPDEGKKTPPDPVKPEPVKPEPPKVVTIPNGLTVAKDGTGQFKTIGEALEKVQPGQTIQVLDDALYDEQVLINDPIRHSGITLEAVKGAILELRIDAKFALKVHAVPNVTVKGFRCQAKGAVEVFDTCIVLVEGRSPGVTISNLKIKTAWKGVGVAVSAAPLQPGDAPIVVRNCQIDIDSIGIVAAGYGLVPAKRVLIQDNRITAPRGIILGELVADIQVSGNILWDCTLAGVELRKLGPGSNGILLANNTVHGSEVGIRLWNEPPSPEGPGKDFHFEKGQVSLVNNVLFQPKLADMILVRAFLQTKKVEAKDSKFLLDLWTFAGNWRDLAGVASQPITPLANGDHELKSDPFLSTVPGHAQFLQPRKDSPLATKGAGKEDFAFPMYPGAVPPEGAEPWNWQWTWDAFMHKTLTVSKDAKDGARFDSINAALDKVRPGMIIRVLDKAVYEEQLDITDPVRHKGIALEAVNGATIALGETAPYALKIEDVAEVTVKGLRFKSEKHIEDLAPGTAYIKYQFVQVKSACPGCLLEALTFKSTNKVGGIFLYRTDLGPGEKPVVVRNCQLDLEGFGVYLTGTQTKPACRIIVCDNTIKGIKAITLEGGVKDILVAGNLIKGGAFAGLELVDIFANSANVLLANNTMHGSDASLRFWEESFPKQIPANQLKFYANILHDASGYDLCYIQKKGANPGLPIDSKFILDLCLFAYNWRDMTTVVEGHITPLADKDHKLQTKEFLSTNPAHKDFLRPRKESPLATDGAGKEDFALPTYVGAIPPEGAAPWNWQGTWDAFMHKTLTVSKDAKDGARFDSIKAALEKVKPGMIIRVLDKAVYEEQLDITDPVRHKGITLEAVNGATIVLGETAPHALNIEGVAEVTVKGLNFKSEKHVEDLETEKYFTKLVQVKSACPGCLLERLTLKSTNKVGGMFIVRTDPGPGEKPLVVRNCHLDVGGNGILISGSHTQLTKRVIICDNTIKALRAVALDGGVKDILLAGNLLRGGKFGGLELLDIFANSANVLVVNNTLFGADDSLRFWEESFPRQIPEQQFKFYANVLYGAFQHDLCYYQKKGANPALAVDSKFLLELCQFAYNWRDMMTIVKEQITPLAHKDHKLQAKEFLSTNPADKNFMRPKQDSPLATGGAGKEDPTLPRYVGAIPPEGFEVWDWQEKTWKAKFERR